MNKLRHHDEFSMHRGPFAFGCKVNARLVDPHTHVVSQKYTFDWLHTTLLSNHQTRALLRCE